MELPQYTDYGKILEMNPFAAWQAGEQMDLARTFQQQKLAQEQESAKAAQLANIFTEQTQPGKIEQEALATEERRLGMPQKRIASQIAEKTAPQQMEAAVKEWAGKVSKAELDDLYRQGQKLAYSGKTPEERKQGVAIMQMHPDLVKLSMEEAGKMAREREKLSSAERRTQMTVSGADRRAASSTNKKQQVTNILDAVRTGKVSPERALAAYQMEEALAEDEETAAMYRDLSARMQTIINNREAAKAAGRPDIGAVTGGGVPTREAPAPYSAPTPAAKSSALGQGRVRVKSPDGKTGTIPESQLQDAIRAGYKRVQ